MSIKRVAESVPMGLWVPAEIAEVYTLCEAILFVFRDEGNRKDRQKVPLRPIPRPICHAAQSRPVPVSATIDATLPRLLTHTPPPHTPQSQTLNPHASPALASTALASALLALCQPFAVSQARLMWLVEEYGVPEFKQKIIEEATSFGRGESPPPHCATALAAK